MNETDGVVPLDIAQLRKTQRRVAALLQTVRTSSEYNPFVTQHKKSTQTTGYQLHSRLNQQHDENKLNFYPRPPNPSAASLATYGNNNEDDYSDIRGLIKSFRPSIQRDYLPDQSSGRQYHLPPLCDDLDRVSFRVKDKTVSDVSNGAPPQFKFPAINSNKITDAANYNSSIGIDGLRLPEIDQFGNLVSSRITDIDKENIERNVGSYSERKLSPIKDSALERNFSFISERTGGSLRIDENYVPMSITITKLSDADIRERTSDLSESSNYQIGWPTDDVKHRSEESSCLNRDRSEESSSLNRDRSEESSSLNRDDSPTDFMSRLRSASWCTCPKSGTGVAPCTECRKVGGHEKWCVSASGLCQFCRKPVKKLHSRHRNENTMGRESLNIDESHDQFTSNSIGKRKSLSHSERRRLREAREKYESDLNTSSSPRLQDNQRVRFQDENHLSETTNSQTANVGESNSAAFSEDNNSNRNKKRKKKKNGDFDKEDGKHQQDDQVISIPKIGVNVHRTAYILALRDSMERTVSKKPKDKKRDRETVDNSTKGTIFSYFTLLKRPHSDPSHHLNLGIKPDLGTMPKDGMKHVFGNIKFSDYYPGGKRWREIHDD